MISNKAVFSRNSAPMLTSFLEKQLRYHEACVLFAVPEPSSLHVCGLKENNASMEVNKERDPKPSERMCHKKIFSIEEMFALVYTKVCQNYFPIEELSAQVYTPRCIWQPRDFRPMFCANFPRQYKDYRQS